MEKPYTDLESNAGSKATILPSTGQERIAIYSSSIRGHASARFIAGTALIAGSFLVYLAYPIILLMLPFSRSIKFGAAVAVWIISWGIFSAGIFLAGPEGFEWLKRFCLRVIPIHSGPKPDSRELSDD